MSSSSPLVCTFHVHRKCTAGASCPPSSHALADACRHHAVCAYYLNGSCTKGDACTRKHITHADLYSLLASSSAAAAGARTHTAAPAGTPPSRGGAAARAAPVASPVRHHGAGVPHPSTPPHAHASTAVVRAHKAPRTTAAAAADAALVPLLSARLGGLALGGHAAGAGAGASASSGPSIWVRETMVPVKTKPVYADVHFYIDVSSSMSGSRLSTCQKALCDFFHSLRDKDCVQLHSFSHVITLVVPYAQKKALTRTFDASVASLCAGGATALRDAVVQSVADVQSAAARIKREREAKGKAADSAYRKQVVVILTDGEDCGSRTSTAEMLAAVRRPGVEAYKTFILAVADARGTPDVAQLQACSTTKSVEVIDAADAASIPAAFTKLKEKLQKVTSISIIVRS